MLVDQWVRYPHLDPIKRLPEEGREFLGKYVYFTEKRDGENVSIHVKCPSPTLTFTISSHNLEVAESNIQSRFMATPEYKKVCDMLVEEQVRYDNHFIVYGELVNKGLTPTRIEREKKYSHWILFDMYDCKTQRFIEYTQLHQLAHHWKLPIVKLLQAAYITNLSGLTEQIALLKAWCKRHRREGIVLKCYDDAFGKQTFAKEKIDLPDLPKRVRPQKSKIQLPAMPEDRILRALQHAFDEVTEVNWKNVKLAMPVVAKHLNVEAREHNFAVPKSMYQIYLSTDIAKLQASHLNTL